MTRWKTAAGALALAVTTGVGAGVGTASAVPTAPVAQGVSIDAGGSATEGGFVPDEFFSSGGLTETKPADKPSLPNFGATVAHPIPASVWNSARYLDTSYTVPGLTAGASYELRLYFMDWYFTRPGQRVFDVRVNDETVLADFDIIKAAVDRGADGQQAFGVERDVKVTADKTGTIRVDFARGVNQPWVNAIKLVPLAAPAPLAQGVSIDAAGSATDGGFIADEFFSGGLVDTKPATTPSLPNFGLTVRHPIPASVWDTARYSDSSYTVPGLTPGADYELRLYFMDWYFTRPGQRVFDVRVNGETVLADFDIIKAAVDRGADGQEAFGVERDVTVTADATGTVKVDFVRGAVNLPQVNALVLVPATS